MIKNCMNCYYKDKCHQEEICEYYYPINQSESEDDVSELIEQNRGNFMEEWLEYIYEDEN